MLVLLRGSRARRRGRPPSTGPVRSSRSSPCPGWSTASSAAAPPASARRSVVITLVVAAAGVAGFLLVQARGRHPMMPLELFRLAGIRIALSVGFAFMAGMVRRHLPGQPLPAATPRTDPAAGRARLPARRRLRRRRQPRERPAHQPVRAPAARRRRSAVDGRRPASPCWLAAPLGSPALTAALLVLIGPGGAVAMPAVTGVVLDSVPPERAGTASAVFNTFRQVGGAVAIAVFGGLLARRRHLRRRAAGQLVIAASPCSSLD